MFTYMPNVSLFEALFKNTKMEYYYGWTASIILKKGSVNFNEILIYCT